MLLGTGAGTYEIAIEFSLGSGTAPRSLVRADFNQDGLADLLTSNYGANDFSLLLGSGNGAFHDSSGTSYSYTGGSSYSPAPSFTFEDLGLSLKITPHIHGTDEVTLDLETEFELLAGTSLNGMPVISNRKLASSVRVRNDEWAFVGGLLNTDEARSISGIAGLSSLPAIGALMRQVTHNRDSSEVLIMLRTILIDAPPDPSATHTVRVGSETRPLTPM